MQASPRVKDFIKSIEGCKLRVYPDLNGFPTLGWGHKLSHAEIVQFAAVGNVCTQAWADAQLDADIASHEADVNSQNLLNLSQGKYDALVDFDYNLGDNNLFVMLSHGIGMVDQQLPRWVYANKKIEPGLVKRRQVELAWWRE